MQAQVAAALGVLPLYLGSHVALSAAALGLALLISAPLAVLAARSPRVRWPVLALASLIQTIPSLALLALFYPLLLLLSAAARAAFGTGLPALGFLPALMALTLYALLPILRNGVAGLTGVDPAVIEAADGVGMTRTQRLWRVEAPLAAPVAMAGVRTAAVLTIGTATLATPIGQVSLGNYIFTGLQTENWVFVLFGCAAAAGLALIADQLLGLVEAGVRRRDLRRILLGVAALLAGIAAALSPLMAQSGPRYVIGAKNFSEQFILARLIGDRLEARGARVEEKDGLGSAVAFRALAAGDIDVYVDYSGTLWADVLGRKEAPPRAQLAVELTRELQRRYGVRVLGSLGFENAYVFAMKPERAEALEVRDIAALAAKAPALALGTDLEFPSRPEWTALRRAYGLKFRVVRSFNPSFMYRALQDGEADVITAFSSDGRIAAQRLTVLADPKGAIPPYDALVLVSPKRAKDPVLIGALTPLIGAIPVAQMRAANLLVDRASDKQTPEAAARALARSIGR
jgi:osmoprotectant transport system permease protein